MVLAKVDDALAQKLEEEKISMKKGVEKKDAAMQQKVAELLAK